MDAKDKELAALLLNKFINADSDTEKNYYMTVLYKLYRKDIVRYAKSLVHYLTTLDIYDIEQEQVSPSLRLCFLILQKNINPLTSGFTTTF
ncbi:hypothetical protein DW044_12345 [Lachnospira eligens]|nr:hypothetical protein DW044_12345 [Lachnospira eligens]